MSCPRCQGFLYVQLVDDAVEVFEQTVCLNCGNRMQAGLPDRTPWKVRYPHLPPLAVTLKPVPA